MLKRGSQGELVIELQEKLLSLGYELPKFGADGDFGSETVSLSRNWLIWQKRRAYQLSFSG